MSDYPQHPGTIRFFDGATNSVVGEEPASELPDEVKFAKDASGAWQPVVKVVRLKMGQTQAEIKEYGPQDQLLRTTRMRKD